MKKLFLLLTTYCLLLTAAHAQNPVTAPEVRIPGKAQNKVKRIQQPMTGVLFYRLSDSTMCVRNPDNTVTPLSGNAGDYSPWDTTATAIIQKDTTLNVGIGTDTPFAKLTSWGNGSIGWGDTVNYTDYRFLFVDTNSISLNIGDSLSSYSVSLSRTDGMSINHTFPNGTKNYVSMENGVIRLGSDNGDELASDYFDNHVELDTLGNISIYTMTAGDVVRANLTLDTFGTVSIDTATVVRFRPLATNGAPQFVTTDSLGNLNKSGGTNLLGFTTDANNNMYAGSDLPLLGASTNILAIGIQTGDSLANCEGCVLLGNQANTYNTGVTQYAIAIGENAIASDIGISIGTSSLSLYNSIALGVGSVAQDNGIAIGGVTQASTDNIAIGNTATAAGLYSISIGSGSFSNDTSVILLGAVNGQKHSFVVGETDATDIRDVFIGGIVDDTPRDITIQPSGGDGTNVAGANISLVGGRGTGNATANGYISLKTSDAGASGSTMQSLSEKARFTKGGDLVLGIQSDTVGLVLKSPNGHYWRATISDIGIVTWTDIGTSIP